MHEMSIAENLFEIVVETIEKEEDIAKVEAVDLRIGKLRAVIPENLTFCFEVLCRGTAIEGARLRIEEIPIRVICKDCMEETEKTDPVFLCSKCGSPKLDLLSGKELEIRSIEVEDNR